MSAKSEPIPNLNLTLTHPKLNHPPLFFHCPHMQESSLRNTLQKHLKTLSPPSPSPPHIKSHKGPQFPHPPKTLPSCCFSLHCRAEQPEAVKETLVAPLLAGLASHHAGCLPAWKALVERCFQQGLLKVLGPTHTYEPCLYSSWQHL